MKKVIIVLIVAIIMMTLFICEKSTEQYIFKKLDEDGYKNILIVETVNDYRWDITAVTKEGYAATGYYEIHDGEVGLIMMSWSPTISGLA